jgi:DNA-binding response OmpR family regulator
MKILVIEDDQLVADTLLELLTTQTHAVEVASDGETGANLLKTYEYDLVILDLTLPKIDGLSLCRQIRAQGSQVPILILTGRDDHHIKAIGLDAGADDYVVKPFDPEELLARVRALLRRTGESVQVILTWGDLKLNPSSCQVTYADRVVALTPKEYALTELFLRNPQRVFSCSAILDRLWSYEEAPGEEAVRTHIKGLRQKLKAADSGIDMIETVYGIGYRLRSKQHGLKGNSLIEHQKNGSKIPSWGVLSDQQEQDVRVKIQQIWQQSQDRIQAQLDVIQLLLIAISEQSTDSQGLLAPELCQNAMIEAHTLAGSLGIFGLVQGSHLAKQIETVLKTAGNLSSKLPELQACFVELQQEIQSSRQPQNPKPEPLGNAPRVENADHLPLLLVIDADAQLVQNLIQDGTLSQFCIKVVKDFKRAKEQIKHKLPSVILFDPDVSKKIGDSVTFLKQLSQHSPPIPTVIFTAHAALSKRRNLLLKSGGSIFLPKPATAVQILGALQQAISRSDELRSHILVVDNDPTTLTLIQHLLQPWGLNVITLADPKQFWHILETTRPDLLILDILMPDVNGIELCQIVRGDAYWSELPIVILTSHQDSETINQVFSAGADDFVTKPIVGPELVTRIINRLERMKLIQHRYSTASKSLPANSNIID